MSRPKASMAAHAVLFATTGGLGNIAYQAHVQSKKAAYDSAKATPTTYVGVGGWRSASNIVINNNAGADEASLKLAEKAIADAAQAQAEKHERELAHQAELARIQQEQIEKEKAALEEKNRHLLRDMWLQSKDGKAYRKWEAKSVQWLREANAELDRRQKLAKAAVKDAKDATERFPDAVGYNPRARAEQELCLLGRLDYCGYATVAAAQSATSNIVSEVKTKLETFTALFNSMKKQVADGYVQPIKSALPEFPQFDGFDLVLLGHGPKALKAIATELPAQPAEELSVSEYQELFQGATNWLVNAALELESRQSLSQAAAVDAKEALERFPVAEPPQQSDEKYAVPNLVIPWLGAISGLSLVVLAAVGLALASPRWYFIVLASLLVLASGAAVYLWNEKFRKPAVAAHNELIARQQAAYQADLVFYNEPENRAVRELQIMSRVDYCGFESIEQAQAKAGASISKIEGKLTAFATALNSVTRPDAQNSGATQPLEFPQVVVFDSSAFGTGPEVNKTLNRIKSQQKRPVVTTLKFAYPYAEDHSIYNFDAKELSPAASEFSVESDNDDFAKLAQIAEQAENAEMSLVS